MTVECDEGGRHRVRAARHGTYTLDLGEGARTEVLFHLSLEMVVRRRVAYVTRYQRARERPGLRLCVTDDWRVTVERAQPIGLPGFEDGVALLDLLDALPGERREAFVLTQLMGLPYAEAAEASGCPIGTIRSRVARARTTLIELLAEAEATAEPTPLAA